MRRTLIVALTLTTALAADTPAPKPILGFSDPAKEHALEARFDAALNRDEMRAWLKRLSARPHHVGSPYGKENAEFIASLFRSWGYDTAIERFDVLFPTPKTRVVELVAPTRFTAKLMEPPLPEDATSNQVSEILPPFNAYSVDGDVTGDLVYVNYGVPKDYEVLERNGIDVRGKIVIARYGGSWRGIKPKVAAEHGAIGCLIYSDPRDDGYFQGDAYPKGAYRSEAATITKIPVLPIAYADALPLLRAMSGPVAPPDWRGALPITYHLGAGPARVHLKLEFNWNLVPAYDVIARLKGTDLADQWIVRGNHHDGWVHGARDPLSGQVAMLEEARGVAELAKSGWRPRRTMIYCAWDAEEPGLLGSTEWVETHLAELQEHAAVYINSDSTSRGFLDVAGSHTLERLVTEVARDVEDPQRNVSVLERLNALAITELTSPEKQKEFRDRKLMRLDALGSGSDYTPFLQHAGIASLNVGYGGEGEYGVYHSAYDSFDHFIRFGDPKFDYEIAQAETTGRMSLRLLNADFLPLEVTTFADTVARYETEVENLAKDMREETEEQNRELREHTMEIAADPTKPFVAPKAAEPVPYLDLSPPQNAVARLKTAARTFDAAPSHDDRILMHLEHALTRDQGLPMRPWYRHHVYAPGYYTGYGVKTLPGLREALEQRNRKDANDQIDILAGVLERYAKMLEDGGSR